MLKISQRFVWDLVGLGAVHVVLQLFAVSCKGVAGPSDPRSFLSDTISPAPRAVEVDRAAEKRNNTDCHDYNEDEAENVFLVFEAFSELLVLEDAALQLVSNLDGAGDVHREWRKISVVLSDCFSAMSEAAMLAIAFG